MSLRYWIADFITGGALTRALDNAKHSLISEDQAWELRDKSARMLQLAEAQAREATARAHELQCDLNVLRIDNANGWHNSSRFSEALNRIAAMETEHANATVRRMSRVAQEAVKP